MSRYSRDRKSSRRESSRPEAAVRDAADRDSATAPFKPVIVVTLYDQVSSWLISIVAGLGIAAALITLVWISNLIPPKPEPVPIEVIDSPGGFEDGNPDETLRVDSPEPEQREASLAEVAAEQHEVAETLDAVVEMTDAAAQQVVQQFDTGIQNTGVVGSAKGTGGRPLGSGQGTGGYPREQRWFVRFSDKVGLDEYARQLDFFRIELGALLPDGRLCYLSDVSSGPGRIRYSKSGSGEARMYMTWQGGERRAADGELFKRAGIEIPQSAILMHFYAKETENQLAVLERDYRGLQGKQIKRTYFAVDGGAGRYKFVVTRQIPF